MFAISFCSYLISIVWHNLTLQRKWLTYACVTLEWNVWFKELDHNRSSFDLKRFKISCFGQTLCRKGESNAPRYCVSAGAPDPHWKRDVKGAQKEYCVHKCPNASSYKNKNGKIVYLSNTGYKNPCTENGAPCVAKEGRGGEGH